MDEYTEVLTEWAASELGVTPSEVDRVVVEHDPGYRYSSWTFEDPHTDVRAYMKSGPPRLIDIENMGDLLTKLFKVAESRDA